MKRLYILIMIAASPLALGSSSDYSNVFPFSISKMVIDPSHPCADAEKSIPAGYKPDPANSPVLHCSSGGTYDDCDASKGFRKCTIPLVRNVIKNSK
jgi:hypothetical protein